MPRIGVNPNVNSRAYQYNDIVLTAITHLPNDEGYHNKRFEIVKICLESMRENCDVKSTVIIWDNGSHEYFRNWLRHEYKPDILIESPNIGKTNARTNLFRICPPHCIVSYTDDDMLFYPNWLNPQVEILKKFPNVACVSGWPVRTSARWGNQNTLVWARENNLLEEGRFISDEWEYDFALSVEQNPQRHFDDSLNDVDYRITYNGLQAYAMAQHCQFIACAPTVAEMPLYHSQAMRYQREFDMRMDGLGLRLTTIQRLCRHMGNRIDDKLRQEINAMELSYAI